MRSIIAFFLTAWLALPAHALPHISVDLDSGRVLSAQQAFDLWHPASLTKLMTALVAFRAIESGRLTADHPVIVSDNARKAPPSKMGYSRGTTMRLEDALKLLLIKSANDISIALAESVSGSVPAFSQAMNAEAARLGMTGSNFVNPHGLHDRRQVTTARDMAILLRVLHKQYPQYKAMLSTPSLLAPSRTKNGKTIQRVYYSYNLLLERFRGADGFKTGFVCASGYNFAGAATRSGRRIAAIVLGRDGQTSRAVDAAKLIEEGFRLPTTTGTPITELKPNGAVPSGPRNMRSVMCTEAARAARYEPGAGQAVIDSPWLQERKVMGSPLVVKLLGRQAAALASARVTLPSFRPDFTSVAVAEIRTAPVNVAPVDAAPVTPVEVPEPTAAPIANIIEASNRPVALPTFRPAS
ncbi:D-alanyl-D-alanine carboxypeptidase family protein [Ahrensia sp. R2A130]|uniref:D-alanyl-D-alanine carboxypeptidase family protein n=1 Tax=Ahrensia sp. R2A130 TaxID=744979 RepID=UPI0018DD2E32|nr:D-alanyl-D-alanine carboxypeptidase family protein [Ahrensia sp. R2A130]